MFLLLYPVPTDPPSASVPRLFLSQMPAIGNSHSFSGPVIIGGSSPRLVHAFRRCSLPSGHCLLVSYLSQGLAGVVVVVARPPILLLLSPALRKWPRWTPGRAEGECCAHSPGQKQPRRRPWAAVVIVGRVEEKSRRALGATGVHATRSSLRSSCSCRCGCY